MWCFELCGMDMGRVRGLRLAGVMPITGAPAASNAASLAAIADDRLLRALLLFRFFLGSPCDGVDTPVAPLSWPSAGGVAVSAALPAASAGSAGVVALPTAFAWLPSTTAPLAASGVVGDATLDGAARGAAAPGEPGS